MGFYIFNGRGYEKIMLMRAHWRLWKLWQRLLVFVSVLNGVVLCYGYLHFNISGSSFPLPNKSQVLCSLLSLTIRVLFCFPGTKDVRTEGWRGVKSDEMELVSGEMLRFRKAKARLKGGKWGSRFMSSLRVLEGRGSQSRACCQHVRCAPDSACPTQGAPVTLT